MLNAAIEPIARCSGGKCALIPARRAAYALGPRFSRIQISKVEFRRCGRPRWAYARQRRAGLVGHLGMSAQPSAAIPLITSARRSLRLNLLVTARSAWWANDRHALASGIRRRYHNVLIASGGRLDDPMRVGELVAE
jgi:hypothetical protein